MDKVFIDCGGPVHHIIAGGKRFDFEDHWVCGPTVLKKNGEPRRRQPGPRAPFWKAYWCWKHGAKVYPLKGLFTE